MVTRHSRPAAIIAVGLILLGLGCARPPTTSELQAKFAEAERLCLDQKYAEAQAALKAYLMLDPLHPGAHYYLARTYVMSRDVRYMGLAENEYQTALRLLDGRGRESGITRFDPNYFELMCNVDSARALYLQATIFAQDRTQWDISLGSLARAKAYLSRARTVNPNATETTEIENLVDELAAILTGQHR